MALIEVDRLSKTYRTFKKSPGFWGSLKGLVRRQYEDSKAVDSVSFAIESGELVGFLGPNGAGKTTTLKMLSGLLHPTSGEARVMGYTPWERQDGYRRQFALLLGQKNQLWWDLPAFESLQLNAKIYGLKKEDFETTVDQLTSLLEVKPKLQVMVRELSLGERMKFELIASLLHHPKLLLLDEPTIGLDVVSQKTVREFLSDYNVHHGTTMMLTSHYMADIQALCERVIIIDQGKITFEGELSEVVDRFADHKLVTIQWEGALNRKAAWFAEFGEVIELEAARVKLKVPRAQVIPSCKQLLDQVPVSDIDIKEMPIEDIISEVFRR
ncbi:MAG: ABC transporter ATP-binding protein NatA [Verrucomicrobia subdivision 3 bacterium]|nr:ABC transporter ATP-binding protein NatA [Limisphaerales bacterium]MCS1416892.1 ABC transporter ATP-binding protein NatA [Limisphaerales bacterium]